MTSHPPAGRHRAPVRALVAALAMLAAMLVTQSVPPPAGASATPSLEITLIPSVMAELDGAGLVITGADGAVLNDVGAGPVLHLPLWYPTTYGYDAGGRRTITTALLGRLDVWSWRTGVGVSLSNLEAVVTLDGIPALIDLYGRIDGGERIRIGFASNHPALDRVFFADPNFAMLASFIAEAPVFTRTVPAGDPPLRLWGSVTNGNVLVPTIRPGDPDPWTGQPTALARGRQGVARAA